MDALGNIYVADGRSDRVLKLAPDGRPIAAWGALPSDPVHFNHPTGLALDGGGNVYVVEYYGNMVKKLSPAGALLAVWR